jgi:hypothetical protein
MGVEDFADIATEAFDVASETLSDGAEFLSDGFDQLQEQVFDFAGEADWFDSNFIGDIVPNDVTTLTSSFNLDSLSSFSSEFPSLSSILPSSLPSLDSFTSGLPNVSSLTSSFPSLSGIIDKVPSANSLFDSAVKQVSSAAVRTVNGLVAQAQTTAVNLVTSTANQALSTVVGPAAAATITGSVTRSLTGPATTGTRPVTDPSNPGFVGPPAPSTVDTAAGNVGYVTGQDPENGTYYVKNEVTGAIVSSGLTEQQATLKAQDQTFIDAGDVPAGANASSTAVNYTAPVATDDTNVGALGTVDTVVRASTPGTVNDINLALPPLSTAAALAAAASLVPGGTTATTAIADAAARAQGLLRQAQNQQTARVQANNNAATGDWRVRLQLADSSDYLYNAPDCGPLLWPLRDTNGVIFPYTPTIDTSYKANYSTYDLTHSNYRGYFYQNSYIDGINIKGTFTAQDSAEANYLLAVIHFFRSVTKMFYGQDAQRGTPPPLVFLSGLGDFQFNKHPCVVSQFNYNLPSDVNYIRAQSTLSNGGNQLAARTRQTTLGNPIASTIQRLSSLGQKIFPGAVTAPFAPQGSLAAGNPTYVPTKMEISLVLLPVQTRSQVSQQFSVRGFANGNLLKGGFW